VSDNDQSELKHVCFACVGEEFLSAEIKKGGKAVCRQNISDDLRLSLREYLAHLI